MRGWRWLTIPLLLAAAGPVVAGGPLLESSGPIVRPVAHTGFWCPYSLYQTLEFTADGPQATLVFTAQTHGNDFYNPGQWMRQRIDNVVVVRRDVHDAHLQLFSAEDFYCLFSDELLFVWHAVPEAQIVFKDEFHDGVSLLWDQSAGAYFAAADSGPNDLFTHDPDTQPGGGSLGLGQQSDPPGMASTSVTVEGLEAGIPYVVHFWWRSNQDGFTEDFDEIADGDLWVEIYGTDPAVSSEPSTWGAVKALHNGRR